MCAQTHGCAYVQPHTPTRPYVYTHTYARIRAREGIFLTSNLLYSIAKPSSIISPIAFTSIIQSLYNPIYIGTSIATLSVQTDIICHSFSTHLPFISNYLPTIHQLSIISKLFPIYYHWHPSSQQTHPYIIFYLYLISSPTNHPINMSVCYKTLSILYILSALPYTAVSHLI